MLRIILIIAIVCSALSIKAQSLFTEESSILTPLQDNDAMMHTHFKLDDNKIKASFEIVLPYDARLIASAYKLSYLKYTDSSLSQIIDIAVNTIAQITDSFKDAGATKIVNIHIPMANDPVTVNYKELPMGTTLVISNHLQSRLKIGYDTIRILKTYSEKANKDKSISLGQVQYLFLVKDIDDLAKLRYEKEILANIGHTMDSVACKEDKLARALDKVFYFDLKAQYNPLTTSKKTSDKLAISNSSNLSPASPRPLSFLMGFGADLIRNTWMPSIEVGLRSYYFNQETQRINFITLYISGAGYYKQINDAAYNEYGTAYINLGFGTKFAKTTVPFSSLGLALGYKVSSNDPFTQGRYFRGVISCGITPVIRINFSANDNVERHQSSRSYLDFGATLDIL